MKYNIKKEKKKKKIFSEVELLRQKISEIKDLKKVQKQTENALKISQANFLTLFENSPDAIFVEDLEGNILNVNPKAAELHGLPPEKLIGMNASDLVPEEIKDEVKSSLFLHSKMTKGFFESQSKKKDGTAVPVEISLNRITYANSPAMLLHVRDITERKNSREELKRHRDKLEQLVKERTFELHSRNIQLQNEISDRKRLQKQLFQSQKLEAVGRLAGGIAHDFNNILTVISGYGELILKDIKKTNKLYPKVKQIKLSAEKAEALTRQLLAFSRKQVLQAKTVNLNDLFKGMEKFLRRLLKEDIKIKKILAKKLDNIFVDPVQIEQVIMNLFINASDAISTGGTITVRTENVVLEGKVVEGIEMVPGKYVSMIISDTGAGMDEKTRLKIFDPFFTTKTSGRGTGLGLSVVYGIIKQSKGYIWVKSKPGKGSSFEIHLPAVTNKIKKESPKKKSETLSEGSETIIVVEDNKSVRNIICDFLITSGYKVLSASNGKEVLSFPKSKKKSADLILSDIVMPFMGGPELVKIMLKDFPDLKVLYMSGYMDDSAVKKDILDMNQHYLQKPFSSKVLLIKIRELLDSNKNNNSK